MHEVFGEATCFALTAACRQAGWRWLGSGRAWHAGTSTTRLGLRGKLSLTNGMIFGDQQKSCSEVNISLLYRQGGFTAPGMLYLVYKSNQMTRYHFSG